MCAGARIAAGARGPIFDGKGAKAAQLDAIAARHGGDNLIEDSVDDILHVALVEMRILQRDALNELGFDHSTLPVVAPDLQATLFEHLLFRKSGPHLWIKSDAKLCGTCSNSTAEGAKGPIDRQG